uniref:Uncharacterized protein n=1 Tax=Angiostrongylus cantonensis TaxID=6313 RepID=A0A0K0D620_ANGCA
MGRITSIFQKKDILHSITALSQTWVIRPILRSHCDGSQGDIDYVEPFLDFENACPQDDESDLFDLYERLISHCTDVLADGKNYGKGCVLCPNPDTSSAYNTGGESCRSDSITPDGTVKPSQAPVLNELVTIAMPPRSPRLLHRSKNMLAPADVDEDVHVNSRLPSLGTENRSREF